MTDADRLARERQIQGNIGLSAWEFDFRDACKFLFDQLAAARQARETLEQALQELFVVVEGPYHITDWFKPIANLRALLPVAGER